MVGYATLTGGSVLESFSDNLYKLTHWLSQVPTFWVVGGVILFLLLVHFFIKKV